MALLLYDHPLSPYAQKVKLALHYKGVPFESRLPERLGSGAASPEFLAASPRGEVPAIVDGDVRIFESSVILAWIEERWPDPPLLPDPPDERARVRMLETVLDTHCEAVNWAQGELAWFGRGGDRADELRTAAAADTAHWHRWLGDRLRGRPCFNGDTWGHGDVAVLPWVDGAAAFGLGPPEGSDLAAWYARAGTREDVRRVRAEAAAVAAATARGAGMAAVREAVEAGTFRREYRDHRLEWMIRNGGLEVVRDGIRKGNVRFTEPFP